jgi:hypothetical protein
MRTKLYGWQEDGRWFLSRFKNEAGRAKNEYATQQEVLIEANKRDADVQWLP